MGSNETSSEGESRHVTACTCDSVLNERIALRKGVSMKILALGGAGDMGRAAVTTLLGMFGISSVTVADANYELAERFVRLIAAGNLSAAPIDVRDRSALHSLIEKHDLVVSTVGPYYKYGKTVVEACISAGRSGIDINDDWEPTLDILALHEKAKNAGITYITGMGSSPGLLNLMALQASRALEQVESIMTAWSLNGGWQSGPKQPFHVARRLLGLGDAERPNAAIEHLFHECSSTVPTYRDGNLVGVDSMTSAGSLQFPGYADRQVFHVGHPEPITLPKTSNAKSVSNVMFGDKEIFDLIRRIADSIKRGRLSVEDGAHSFEDEAKNLAPVSSNIDDPPGLCSVVTGWTGEKRKKIAWGLIRGPYGLMAGVTAVPLAIAARMIADGRIAKRGVFPPESSVDPERLFAEFAPYCGENLGSDDIIIRREEALDSV